MSNISANVTRLKFMQSGKAKEEKKLDNWSRVFLVEPEWCSLSREEFNAIPEEQLPVSFKESFSCDKILVSAQYRRSYKGCNPPIEKHQKVIRNMQKKMAAEDDTPSAAPENDQ
ncbi:M-phase phosphoprotein 6 [Gregarina niphandrodes]|uniref:M-phase phosphoprotein 6 n=1 Tax=Gregarina niphandrodes TaxID=110365 RepID=A0A023B5K2_GRENI|nr:M-phase phosphoprotein 6 [Gregarina niphandrodes]EZG61131.1 M-phase phosphoprotein 6 [Gregarina niphandrodes]|eukprot:XP_011130784.1 M-phase phosphoprotein 6 [Gregarina niphandrodes]